MYGRIDQMNKYIRVVENKARVLTVGEKTELRNRKRKNSVEVETGISMDFFFNYIIYHLTKNEIFSLRYVVDTYDRAKRMKDNFHDKPETIYRGVMGLMAGNVNYLFDK